MQIARSAERATERALEKLARWLAWFGGAILAALSIMTVVSIVGRAFIAFGLSPIKGDFELVEMGSAIAVFAFMPWCQLNRGHVTVDILIGQGPRILMPLTDLIGDLVIAAIAFVIAWRLFAAIPEKRQYGEMTYILGLPIWWGYALASIGAALFFVVSAFTVWRSLNALLRRGRNA
ncbi:MAG: TRAP transporter small permease [Rhodobiaceae bacterium]|nr:TRAP transporter small permease [Rhodobiaceae bacterium]